MTWGELAEEQLAEAQRALDDGRSFRTVCNRAYYATYSVLAELNAGRIAPPPDRRNPAHHQLRDIVWALPGIGPLRRREIGQALERLREARESSDYRPRRTVDRLSALQSMRDCRSVRRLLGVE